LPAYIKCTSCKIEFESKIKFKATYEAYQRLAQTVAYFESCQSCGTCISFGNDNFYWLDNKPD